MQSGTTRTRRSTNVRNAGRQLSRAAKPGAGGGFAESVAGSCTIIRNGRKSGRRKFTDTLRSLPKELRSRSPAQTGLDFCNRLFALEAEFLRQTLSAEQRYAQRKQRSEPIAGEFFRWAQNEYEKNPVPKSLYGAALGYALRQQSWLMHVFCDGRLELSNNRAERSVRPFAIGRKNLLFSNTPLGAKISAVIYSLVETAKINGLNPASYLEYLLTALPRGSQPEDCLPWLPAAQTVCKA